MKKIHIKIIILLIGFFSSLLIKKEVSFAAGSYQYESCNVAQAVTGDWNNDGISDIGVYYGGSWYLDKNNNGAWEGESVDTYISNFGKGFPTSCPVDNSSIGPEIAVGLWNYGSKNALKDNPFKITANKNYNIKNKDGAIVGQVSGGTATRVTYDGDSYLKAYDSISGTKSKKVFYFDAADGDNSTLIFDVNRPDSTYDQYRGKIKIQYTDSSNLWVINTLPLEHYAWGAGEFTGTGAFEHTKTMSTIFRTYGYWYIKYATKYNGYGFKIKSDSGNQIYRGYDWEKTYANVKKAAQETRGTIATYDNDVALTPYSSWSDGRTRSYEERWGSTDYPWCKSVSDPYGKNSTMTTAQLEAAGNHMVGLIAHGSLHLADEHDWSYNKILKYYYTGISLNPNY